MTNMSKEIEVVLKSDKRGRIRRPEEQREKLLDEFERSGLSGPRFAALAGVNYQTFIGWIVRRRRQRGLEKPSEKPDPVRWVEAVVQEAAGNSSQLKVHLPGGSWIELSDPGQVPVTAALLRALQ